MYDPTKPATGSALSSAEMRSQLQGLADMIAAVPAGPPGPEGPVGPPGPMLNGAAVDSVVTGPPGGSAFVSASVDMTGIIRFVFELPQGIQGAPGEVSQAELNNEIANVGNFCISGSSNNSNAVGTLDVPFVTPELEVLRQKLNELIMALRR